MERLELERRKQELEKEKVELQTKLNKILPKFEDDETGEYDIHADMHFHSRNRLTDQLKQTDEELKVIDKTLQSLPIKAEDQVFGGFRRQKRKSKSRSRSRRRQGSFRKSKRRF